MAEQEEFTITTLNAKPSTLFLVVGNDGVVFACQDKLLVRANDKDSGKWIRYTLGKIGFLDNRKETQ